MNAPGPRPARLGFTALVLLGLAALICARMPDIVLRGRLWAEEGKFFFADAWTMTPVAALLTPVGGYLNLVANAGTLAARTLVPLSMAPVVTTGLSLVIQLLTPALLLGAPDRWLGAPAVRLLGCLLVVVIPATEEIWLQTLHCQFQLALAAAVITALDAPPPGRGAGRLLVLLLAPLSGPGAFAVLPVLALRTALAPRAERAARGAQFAALAAGASLQWGFFFNAGLGRNVTVRPLLFLRIFGAKHVLLPFLGIDRAGALFAPLHAAIEAHRAPLWSLLLPLAAGGALAAAAARRRSHAALWLLAPGIGIASLSYYGALGSDPAIMIDARLGERYAFVPQALIGLSVLALAATAGGATRVVASLAIAWLLVVGALDYRNTWPFVSEGPAWHTQIKRWHRDPTTAIALWPEGWTLHLAPQPR